MFSRPFSSISPLEIDPEFDSDDFGGPDVHFGWISQSYQISEISRDSRDARESRVQRVRGFQGCQDSRDAKDSMAKMGNSHRIDPNPSKMHVRPTKIIRIKFRTDFKR